MRKRLAAVLAAALLGGTLISSPLAWAEDAPDTSVETAAAAEAAPDPAPAPGSAPAASEPEPAPVPEPPKSDPVEADPVEEPQKGEAADPASEPKQARAPAKVEVQTETNPNPSVCHPVNGKGELGNGWNLIPPDQASSHIDEAKYPGGTYWKHEFDGRHDRYASAEGTCPGDPIIEPEVITEWHTWNVVGGIKDSFNKSNPDSNNADDVNWPQTYVGPGQLTPTECGVWYQQDQYKGTRAEIDAVLDGGSLTKGEDYSIVQPGWHFVYGGDCVVEVTPAELVATPGTCLAKGSVNAVNTDQYTWKVTGPENARVYTAQPIGDVVLTGKTVYGPFDLTQTPWTDEACQPYFTVEQKCGEATITFHNLSKWDRWPDYTFTGDTKVPTDYGSGPTYNVVKVLAGQTKVIATVTFPEDDGPASVTYQDILGAERDIDTAAQTVTVLDTDCLPNVVEVTPPTPKWVDVCGPDNGYWTNYENGTGYEFTISEDGLTITVKALEGYAFNEGQETEWTATVNDEPCPIPVTLANPTFKDVCGVADDRALLPKDSAGVTYGWADESGYDVTATIADGYVVEGEPTGWVKQEDGTYLFAFDPAFTDDPCDTPDEPVTPDEPELARTGFDSDGLIGLSVLAGLLGTVLLGVARRR